VAKESREEAQQRRALEELAAAQSRGDAELGASALFLLSPVSREQHLPWVARLACAAIAREHRSGNWSRLDFWAARVDREPRLLSAAGTEGGADEAAWALLWACARSKQWDRARRNLAAVAERLGPRLRGAIAGYLDAEGAPAPEPYRALAAAPAPADPRLGYDRGQAAARPPPALRAPEAEAEVEQAVLAAKASRSAREFAAAVEGWAEATPTLAPSILGLAARLQRGEVLAQMARGGSALAPVLVLVGFLRRLRFPAELEDEMGLALRIAAALRAGAAGSAGSKDGLLREDARSFAAIVRAAVPYAGLRSCALALTLETRFAADARAVALDLLEELCRLPEAGALKLEALIAWDLDAQPHGVPPKWILSGLCDVLRRPGELARSLAQLPEDARWSALALGPRVLPLQDAESFWQQAWAWADDAAKRSLLDSFDELLSRARGEAARRLSPSAIEHLVIEMAQFSGFDLGEELEDLPRFLSSPEGRAIARELERGFAQSEGGPLPPAARRLWDRFADQIIPFRISYLETALEQGGRKPVRMAAVARFLGGERLQDARAVLEAIRSAEGEDCRLASKALLEHLLAFLKGDCEGLAKALLEAGRLRLRRGIRGPLGRAFESADRSASEGGRADSQDLLAARLELSLLGRRGPAKGGARKPRRRGAARRGQGHARFRFGTEEER
jgi:hypothetical protein